MAITNDIEKFVKAQLGLSQMPTDQDFNSGKRIKSCLADREKPRPIAHLYNAFRRAAIGLAGDDLRAIVNEARKLCKDESHQVLGRLLARSGLNIEQSGEQSAPSGIASVLFPLAQPHTIPKTKTGWILELEARARQEDGSTGSPSIKLAEESIFKPSDFDSVKDSVKSSLRWYADLGGDTVTKRLIQSSHISIFIGPVDQCYFEHHNQPNPANMVQAFTPKRDCNFDGVSFGLAMALACFAAATGAVLPPTIATGESKFNDRGAFVGKISEFETKMRIVDNFGEFARAGGKKASDCFKFFIPGQNYTPGAGRVITTTELNTIFREVVDGFEEWRKAFSGKIEVDSEDMDDAAKSLEPNQCAVFHVDWNDDTEQAAKRLCSAALARKNFTYVPVVASLKDFKRFVKGWPAGDARGLSKWVCLQLKAAVGKKEVITSGEWANAYNLLLSPREGRGFAWILFESSSEERWKDPEVVTDSRKAAIEIWDNNEIFHSRPMAVVTSDVHAATEVNEMVPVKWKSSPALI